METRKKKRSDIVQVASRLRGLLDKFIEGDEEAPGMRNLLEYAAEHGVVDLSEICCASNVGASTGAAGQEAPTTIKTSACTQQAAFPDPMNPVLWGRLPEEVIELIFAKLSLPQIFSLGSLSKKWNWKLKERDSALRKEIANSQPKLFAINHKEGKRGVLQVNIFDANSNRWLSLKLFLGFGDIFDRYQMVSASDGGLVCFVSVSKKNRRRNPLLIVVCNPLTQTWVRLPPLNIVETNIMVQIITDRETKEYKVFAVGQTRIRHRERLVAHVYYSRTRKWSGADGYGGVVFGDLYIWDADDYDHAEVLRSCLYNFATGRLVYTDNIPERQGYVDYPSVLVKDHMFVINKRQLVWCTTDVVPSYCILEYQVQDCGLTWTHLKSHDLFLDLLNRIFPSNYELWKYYEFYGCKDFLLIFAHRDAELSEDRLVLPLLYDLSTCKWQPLPTLPGGNDLFYAGDQMYEVRWDAVP